MVGLNFLNRFMTQKNPNMICSVVNDELLKKQETHFIQSEEILRIRKNETHKGTGIIWSKYHEILLY